MKTTFLTHPIRVTLLVAALAGATTLRATTATTIPQPLADASLGQNHYSTIAFSDTAEGDMLRRAYRILATGDHDYKGHRVKAMHAVEAAAKLLDFDIAGDLKDHTPQVISDDKMREAQGLINKVLVSAAVKDQKRITRHLEEAANQIDLALSDR